MTAGIPGWLALVGVVVLAHVIPVALLRIAGKHPIVRDVPLLRLA